MRCTDDRDHDYTDDPNCDDDHDGRRRREFDPPRSHRRRGPSRALWTSDGLETRSRGEREVREVGVGVVNVDARTTAGSVAATTAFDEWTTIFLVGAASAILGAIVAWTAYRGYVRNDSQPMLFLAIGVVFLTTVPFVLSYTIDLLLSATDAQVLLSITACHLLGLLAIVRSFKRPNRSQPRDRP